MTGTNHGPAWCQLAFTFVAATAAMYLPFTYFLWAEPSFARDTMEYTPVLPSMICLIAMAWIGIPVGIFEQAFGMIVTQLAYTAACWTLIHLAWQRSWYWFTSGLALVFGISAYSHFAMFGLWAM